MKYTLPHLQRLVIQRKRACTIAPFFGQLAAISERDGEIRIAIRELLLQ